MKNRKVKTAAIAMGIICSMAATAIATKDIIDNDDRTKTDKERVIDALPHLIFPVVIGGSTILAVCKNEKINKQQNAALLAAYSILHEKLKRIEHSTVYDEEKDCYIPLDNIVRATTGLAAEKKGYKKVPGKDYFVDEFFEYPFYATPEKLHLAERKLNKKFHRTGEATMADLYTYIGCPARGHILDNFGWNKDFLESEFGFEGDIQFAVSTSPNSDVNILKVYPDPLYAYMD